jgi:hypothetical protein
MLGNENLAIYFTPIGCSSKEKSTLISIKFSLKRNKDLKLFSSMNAHYIKHIKC